MAIYRTGQASMDAQGYITGYDTKWREQLTLIRPGATIFFIDAPFQAAVISEVISDTQIRAITTGGAEIGRSNYIILLHDSITVDGLAQDVAETLRYYQSKETQIEEAIEFFKNFDLQKLIDLRDETVRNAAAAAQSEQNAQTWAGQSFNHAESAKVYMQQTQQIKDSALTEVNTARDQGVLAVNQTKDQAVAEMNQIKSDTSALKDQAELARDTAGNHAVDANNAKASAETARDEARQWAQQVNPENLLHKDQNLNDVQDKGAARVALDVPAKSESFLIENNLSEIADRTTAWLNVRPIGSTPLSSDPTEDMDATTKHWVEKKIASDIEDSFAKGVNTTECIATNNASSTPVPGSLINGGKVESVYSINGERVYSSTFENTGWYGQTILTRLTTKHYQTSSEASWDFELNGILRSKKAMRAAGTIGASYLTAYQVAPVWLDGPYSGYSGIIGGGFGTAGGGWRNFISFGSIIYPNEAQYHPNAVIAQCWDYDFSSGESTGVLTRITSFNATSYDITFSRNDGAESYIFSKSPNSDRTLKRDIRAIDTSIALSNIEKMEYCSFIYTNDKKEQVRRGFIAQQLQEIDPQYIRSYENTPGGDKRILCLDENVLLLDALAAIKALRARDVENKERISKLEKEVEELKAAVSALINKPTTLES